MAAALAAGETTALGVAALQSQVLMCASEVAKYLSTMDATQANDLLSVVPVVVEMLVCSATCSVDLHTPLVDNMIEQARVLMGHVGNDEGKFPLHHDIGLLLGSCLVRPACGVIGHAS
jgi:hypothetical protein